MTQIHKQHHQHDRAIPAPHSLLRGLNGDSSQTRRDTILSFCGEVDSARDNRRVVGTLIFSVA